ncbi:hypothetical protein NDU88_001280 [Pleurodeles waltl]|uniref:Uncharacterized protein n=1 Tax=Pleurodeles waltl TaxID=8319 RepID=A0AAV7SYS8_PLEWA|nr:hypothetical protein NDU88_001280 [Pleurodeles waltl]
MPFPVCIQAHTYLKFKYWSGAARGPSNWAPNFYRGLALLQGLTPRRQSEEAPSASPIRWHMGEHPSPSGHPGFSGRDPRRSPVALGPRVSPHAPDPSAPRSEGPPGERPSRGPGRLLCRSAVPPRLRGRAPLSPRERCRPYPATAERQGAPGSPRGSLTIWGEPPGFPQTGHKAL